MANRKPALSTQLKAATARIVELEKLLTTEKQLKEYAGQGRQQAEQELEQVHSFMDAVPGSISREIEGGYGKKNGAMTRLAAWLATK